MDAVLLAAVLMLAWTLRITPGNVPWLPVKVLGLLLYIAVGVVAVRAGAWTAALGVFGWIVSVAITKNPLGFLAGS